MKKKRWAIKLALCLLAGAVVTWGVAWGCAIWSQFGPLSKEVFATDAELPGRCASAGLTLVQSTEKTPRLGFKQASGRGAVLWSYRLSAASEMRDALPFAVVSRWSYSTIGDSGWPWLSMRWMVTDDGVPQIRSGIVPPASIKPRPGPLMAGPLLPATILPLGFTLDTLLYASVTLGLVEGVVFARRRHRRNKGRCPSCGYDRGGLAEGAACPECGGTA